MLDDNDIFGARRVDEQITSGLARGRAGRVAVIVDKYPCVSESFVRREISSLRAWGFMVAVVACAPAARSDMWLDPEPGVEVFRPACAFGEILRGVIAGAESMLNLPLASALFSSGPWHKTAAFRAAWIAAAIRPVLERWKPDWIHAHFLGMPAVAACLIANRSGLPLSISAHARDIFVPVVRLERVCARARFIAACSEHGQASLMGRLPVELADRIEYFPHYIPFDGAAEVRGRRKDTVLRILSVCRLVPKKGIDDVLRAIALLAPDMDYRYRILGSGPELPRLRALVKQLGLNHVKFAGSVSPEAVAKEMAKADIFVLGTRTAPDGDRDGIPNAILEAIAAGLPVVASDGGAVSEVIRHRHTGWLSPPNAPGALADALREAIAAHASRRKTVTTNAAAEIRRRFSSDQNRSLLPRRLARELKYSGSNCRVPDPAGFSESDETRGFPRPLNDAL